MHLRRKNKQPTLFEPKKSIFDNLTWTCHICKEERPDAKISVVTKRVESFTDVEVMESVRYCNDRSWCIEAAKTYTHFHLHIDEELQQEQ